MQDRPTVFELLRGIRTFLQEDIVPSTDGRRQFLARVAANTIDIIERELRTEEEQLREEWAGLQRLLGAEEEPRSFAELRSAVWRRTGELCERIRAGDADEGDWGREVRQHVVRTVHQKMLVTNPGYMSED